MAVIHAFIKKYQNRNNASPVIIEYSHLKERWRINTGILVNAKETKCVYDPDFDSYKLTTLQKLQGPAKEALTNNNQILLSHLQKISSALNDLKARALSLCTANLKVQLSSKPVASTNNRPTANKSLLDWYKEFIETKEKEIGSGINGYRSTYEHFKCFAANKGVLSFQDLTKQFLEEFRENLVALNLGGPTIHKQFRNIKILLNWVQDQDDSITIPAAIKKLKVRARYGDPIGLTMEQFLEFHNINLQHRKQLEITRDVFSFAVSIGGPRHGDLKRLADSLRKNGYRLTDNTITYFESKTGNAHQEISLNKIGMEIMRKYKNEIPHVPSNFRMNKNLKSIAGLLGWDEIKYAPKYDNYGKLISVDEIPLKDIFSTKFMRKTAATIDNMLGVATKTSMKRTGHKTFAAYSRYVDVNKDSLIQANKQWDNLILNKSNEFDQFVTLVEMHELQFAA